MRFQAAACILMLVCVNPAQPKPFNTNINTNYNNNYNTNLNTNYLISSLLNYILNLLQILHNNGRRSGPYTIPAFPRPDEMQQMLKQYPPTALTETSSPNSPNGAQGQSLPSIKGDFTILYDYVFNHLIRNRKTGNNKNNDSTGASGSQDYKKAVQDAVKAFKGPIVPPLVSPIPLDSIGPLSVQEPPELQAAKMEFLRAFAEAQTRSG
jgi:hypothetical protein